MHPHVIVAYNKDTKFVKLDTGSIIAQDDVEHFIAQGCEFVTQDAAGNRSKVHVVTVEDEQHLRAAHNHIVTDNLNNLPTF